jgi:hypothetical protein
LFTLRSVIDLVVIQEDLVRGSVPVCCEPNPKVRIVVGLLWQVKGGVAPRSILSRLQEPTGSTVKPLDQKEIFGIIVHCCPIIFDRNIALVHSAELPLDRGVPLELHTIGTEVGGLFMHLGLVDNPPTRRVISTFEIIGEERCSLDTGLIA